MYRLRIAQRYGPIRHIRTDFEPRRPTRQAQRRTETVQYSPPQRPVAGSSWRSSFEREEAAVPIRALPEERVRPAPFALRALLARSARTRVPPAMPASGSRWDHVAQSVALDKHSSCYHSRPTGAADGTGSRHRRVRAGHRADCAAGQTSDSRPPYSATYLPCPSEPLQSTPSNRGEENFMRAPFALPLVPVAGPARSTEAGVRSRADTVDEERPGSPDAEDRR